MPIVTTRAPSHYKGARRLCIQRENQCDGSIWARDREKNTGQQKSHKSVIFPLFGGGSPVWTDSTQKLHGG